MALVAYDYSDSSDVEESNENTFATVKPIKIEEAQTLTKLEDQRVQSELQNIKAEDIPESVNSSSSKSLFNLLPQPSVKKQSFEEDDDEFLQKKESLSNIAKPKAKIMVPSLSDFKDVEPSIPSAKPKISNGTKSGLLSILPQPRNAVSAATTTKSFVPYVLTQKPTATVKKKPLPSPTKKSKTEVKPLAQDYSDDSDDGEMQNDFFSINKVDDTPIEDMPLDIDLKPKEVKVKSIKTEREPPNLQSYFKQEIPESEAGSSFKEDTASQYMYPQNPTTGYKNEYEAGASNSNDAVLDDEAILKLCGTRGKRKREDIQIVDVNQKEVLADAREWLLKGLMDDTTKRVSASKRRGDEPTSQQRRKHQITYLAHQAKANEAELQNQWANYRMTKRQTQSKYGF